MKVDTRKSNIHVVIIRLLGELEAKAGTADLPLFSLVCRKKNDYVKSIPNIFYSYPRRSSSQVVVR